MEKVNDELIKGYKNAKAETENHAEKLNKMQEQLKQEEANLKTKKDTYQELERSKNQDNFDSVEKVAQARERLHTANNSFKNQAEFVSDIMKALEQNRREVPNLQRKLAAAKSAIFLTLADNKAQEIKKTASQLFVEFVAFQAMANPGTEPFAGGRIPSGLEFISGKGVDLKTIQSETLEYILQD